jgi:hypothetical protein
MIAGGPWPVREMRASTWFLLSLAGAAAPLDAQPLGDCTELLRDLENPERRAAVASELFERGAAGAAALAEVVAELSDEAWEAARRVLVELGPDGAPCWPALVELAGSDARWRSGLYEALFHLALFAPDDGEAIFTDVERFALRTKFDGRAPAAQLADALAAPEAEVRLCAIESLAARGAALRCELADDPALQRAILDQLAAAAAPPVPRSRREGIRPWAALALSRLAPGAPRSLAGHLLELEHPARARRIEALRAVAAFGDARFAVVQALHRALGDADPRVVVEAITAIGALDRGAEGVAGHLQPLAAGEQPAVAAVARSVLLRLGTAGVDVELALSHYDDGRRASRGRRRGAHRVGRWHFWHENGNDQSDGEYVEDREHGAWTFWHQNGAVSAQGQFARGVPSGVWTFRYDDGQVERSGEYEDGRPAGRWSFFDRHGRPLPEKEY